DALVWKLYRRRINVLSEFPSISNIVEILSRAPLNETGRHDMRSAVASVRDFPFPYSAGLAITPGVSWVSRAHFHEVRNFLCGTGKTKYGTALGLEIGGAFTLCRDKRTARFGTPRPGASEDEEGDEAAIIDLAKAGWIDTVRGVTLDDSARQKLEAL